MTPTSFERRCPFTLLQPFGLTSFTWSLGYVLIMWLMLWFLHRNRLFWRVQAANFFNPMNASTL